MKLKSFVVRLLESSFLQLALIIVLMLSACKEDDKTSDTLDSNSTNGIVYVDYAPSVIEASNISTATSTALTSNTSYKNREFQGWPTVARTGNRYWAAWYANSKLYKGGVGDFIVVAFSDDGKTWKEQFYLAYPQKFQNRVFNPQLWVAGNGSLWVLYGVSNGNEYDGVEGAWASIIKNPEVAPSFERSFRLAHGIPGKPIRLLNNDVYIPIDYWGDKLWTGISRKSLFPNQVGRNIFKLDELNNKLNFVGKVSGGKAATFDETSIAQAADGSLVAVFRTGEGLYLSYSYDLGKTWVNTVPFTQYANNGNMRAQLIKSNNNTLLMAFNNNKTQANLSVIESMDNGVTWPNIKLVDSKYPVSNPSLDITDGKILFVYDYYRSSAKQILISQIDYNQLFSSEKPLINEVSSPKDPEKAALAPLENVIYLKTPPDLIPASSDSGFNKRVYQAIPSIQHTGNRYWVTWFADSKINDEVVGNFVVLAASDDKGQSWQEKFYLAYPVGSGNRVFDPQLWRASNGNLWIIYAVSGSNKKWDGVEGAWVTEIKNPDTKPEFVRSFRLAHGVPSRPVRLQNNEVYIPIDFWVSKVRQTPLMSQTGRNVFSLDEVSGSVSFLGQISGGERKTYDETSIAQASNGMLVAIFRTMNGQYISYSKDLGVTWTEGIPFSAYKTPDSRAQIVATPYNTLMMIFNNDALNRFRISIIESKDNAETWSGPCVVNPGKNISYPQLDFSDDKVMAVYDYDRTNTGVIWFGQTSYNTLFSQCDFKSQIISQNR